MKRSLSILLTAVLLLGVCTGCGGIDAEYDDDPDFQASKQYAAAYFTQVYGEDAANYEFEFINFWQDDAGTQYYVFEVSNLMFLCCRIAVTPDGSAAYLNKDCTGESFAPLEPLQA